MRSLVRSSAHLLLPALLISSALTLGAAHQGPSRESPGPDRPVEGALQKIRSFSTSEHGVPRPSGMAWSAQLDALVLTDADHPRVRRAVQPDETDLGQVPAGTAVAEAPPDSVAGRRGHDLRGASIHPETGHLFTYDATTDEVLELRDDLVVAALDASDLAVDDVRGVVMAPSADPTDHPSTLSIYVVDNGAPGNFGEVVEATVESDIALMAAVTPISVRVVATSAFSPPSPDPSGVAYLPGADRLFIADGEVDEMSIFRGANLFTTTRPGELTATGVSQPWSDEPVGVGYNPGNNHLFVSDDDQKEVFELVAGADGRFGTSDDTVTHFDTLSHGAADPEGIEYDPATNSLWFAGGEEAEVHRVQAAGDGRFGTTDDIWTHWDAGIYGMKDPEGIGFDAVRGTVVVIDDSSQTIYELDRTGALLNTIDVSSANMDAAAGLAVAPASNGSGQRTYYVVARGQDNDSHPTENDGRLYEITASLPPLGGGPVNQAPSVSAGTDLSVVLPGSAVLDGTVSDDGLPASPGRVTTSWSQVSGPGSASFGDVSAVDTSATFSVAGTYVLRLSASDGEATVADEVTVFAAPAGGASVIEARVSQGSDDVEQAVSGSVGLTSSDLELTTDGNTQQVVGVRFTNLQVPRGAQLLNAYVQFWTDETSTGASAMTIKAEASDNTPTYVGSTSNVTNRTTTAQNVTWSPPDWTTVGQAGAAQRTPDLSSVLQAVVGRTGWSAGNALALQFSGTGRRTARAFESGAATAALLHVEYTTGGGGATNAPPSVNAGGDATVQLPGSAVLDGTVSDDGLPASPGRVTTSWSQVSGPGSASFGDVSAVDTSASFSVAGTYVLRLSATDGLLSASDEVTIVVQAAGGGGGGQTVEVRVGAGSDDAEQSVGSGKTSTTSGDLELTTDGNTQQVVGVRFGTVAIPAGAHVTNAYLQFTTDEVSTGTSALVIRAENLDNTATYTSTVNAVTGRATTSSFVSWSPPDWTTVGQAAAGQRTPDLSALVQAVVGRAGWAQGNALALQFSGTGVRKARSFDGGAAVAPLLHVEYTTE
jgi:hypothetical protein